MLGAMARLGELSVVLKTPYASQKDVLLRRAAQITAGLRQGERRDFSEVMDLSSGDLHLGGFKPLTFVRQVLAACLYPDLLKDEGLPEDVRRRAEVLLTQCEGQSVGSYTDSAGMEEVRQSVASYISRRDGGGPCSPHNIFITSGSQHALRMVLKLLVGGRGSEQTGVLVPAPSYSSFTRALEEQGVVAVPYLLCEEQGWSLQAEELLRAIHTSPTSGKPVALYICNPGNPTGRVQSRRSMQDVLRLAAGEGLFVMADEVYQDCVIEEDTEILSYRKVLSEMHPSISSSVQLASFNSASKGFIGECGLRGGYVELLNLDPEVMHHTRKLFSTTSCSSVPGQIALHLMTDPPRPGDPSFSTFCEEVDAVRREIAGNARRAVDFLSDLPGISCHALQAGYFLFPRLDFPPRAIAWSQEQQVDLDLLYCLYLLEEGGLHIRPGSEFGQKAGTHHFRVCVAVEQQKMDAALDTLQHAHTRFLQIFDSDT